jgi:hypothetical protein
VLQSLPTGATPKESNIVSLEAHLVDDSILQIQIPLQIEEYVSGISICSSRVSMNIGRQCHCFVDNIVLLNLHEPKFGTPKISYSSSEVGLHSLACPGWNTTTWGKKSLFL